MCLTGHHWITGGNKIDEIYILMYQTEWLHGKGMVTIQGQIVYYPEILHFK